MTAPGYGQYINPTPVDCQQMTISAPGSPVANFAMWAVLRSAIASNDNYFRSGIASSTPISHGLGVIPKTAVIVPIGTGAPSYGVTTVDINHINYTGSGSFYWMALAP